RITFATCAHPSMKHLARAPGSPVPKRHTERINHLEEKSMAKSISRRDALKLMGNIGVVTMAGGMALQARAQQTTAVLGHFGSANPQTLGKALGSFAKAFGSNVKTDFVTVSGGPQVLAAIAGNSMDLCNVGSSPMVVGFAQGIKMSMVYV